MTVTAPILAPRFDAEIVRAQVPILQRRIHGRPLAYLDNAASAQKPEVVIEAMAAAMRGSYANVHRGLHTLANETTEAFEAARASVAGFLNVDVGEVVFTKGSTEGINLVSSGFADQIAPGDEIIVSELEHHSNFVPWHFLRERRGAVLRFVPVTDDGALDLDAYEALLGPRTKIVALTHMSNVTGAVSDAGRIVRGAHAVGAEVLLDGSQAAVHRPALDLSALGVDYYVMTGHKLFGPTGIGVLFGRAERLAALRPYQGGGEMIDSVSKEAVVYAAPPRRFEAGTPPILEAIGLGAAIGWLGGLDRVAACAHENRLASRLSAALIGVPGVRLIGTAPGKGAIVSFHVDGVHAHDLSQILDRYGVAVRAGQHCAEPLMRRFGVHSTTRASFAPYNTDADVDAFLEGFEKARDLLS